MLRFLALALSFSGAASYLFADDNKAGTKPKPQDQLRDLQAAYSKERGAIKKEVDAADPAERDRIARAKHQVLYDTYVPKFMELAKANLGDEVGYTALVFVFQYGGPRKSPEALDLILANYERKLVANPTILERAGTRGEQALRELLAKNVVGDPSVKLSFSLANTILAQADPAAEKETKKAKLAEAERLYELVAANAKAGTREFETAKGLVHEIRNLQIGKIMPDLEGQDLAGNQAKLSDFRGKVVVLDVWATWCSQCRELIPSKRELVKKFDGKPFVLLSVSCDDKKETLTDFLEKKEKMPWAHWWDGRGGPVSKGLNFRNYPTLFVLDAKGAIRYKGVHGDALAAAVERLIKELDAADNPR